MRGRAVTQDDTGQVGMTTMTNPGRPGAAPKRRRAKTIRRLVIALVVLVGLLVIADFAAAAIFEHEVSKRARDQFGLSDDPDVTVGGFSFLLQAFSGEYDEVKIDARGVPVKDTLRDVDVTVTLHHVHAPLGDLISGNVKAISVDEADGTVNINAADVNRALARNENNLVKSISQLSIEPISLPEITDPNAKPPADNQPPKDPTKAGAKICATGDIAEQSTNFCAFGTIALVNQKIAFQPARLTYGNSLSGGTLPASVQRLVQPLLSFNLDPGNLPFKVTPTAVSVTPGVLSVSGKAENVSLSGAPG
jgi:hypothetical protein